MLNITSGTIKNEPIYRLLNLGMLKGENFNILHYIELPKKNVSR